MLIIIIPNRIVLRFSFDQIYFHLYPKPVCNYYYYIILSSLISLSKTASYLLFLKISQKWLGSCSVHCSSTFWSGSSYWWWSFLIHGSVDGPRNRSTEINSHLFPLLFFLVSSWLQKLSCTFHTSFKNTPPRLLALWFLCSLRPRTLEPVWTWILMGGQQERLRFLAFKIQQIILGLKLKEYNPIKKNILLVKDSNISFMRL